MDILLPLLTISDEYFAEIRRRKGCSFCGGTLHAAHYYRGTRGPGIHCELLRFSYCCSRQGCRKRHTPPSVRFLGPKVYLGLVIILISAAHLLLDPKDANGVRERFGIDRRTVGRWRNWWIFGFIATFFWKDARGPVRSSPRSWRFAGFALQRFHDSIRKLRHSVTTLSGTIGQAHGVSPASLRSVAFFRALSGLAPFPQRTPGDNSSRHEVKGIITSSTTRPTNTFHGK